MNGNTIFLAESPHGWGGVWQRPHHLFRLLSEKWPCYYVATRYLRDAWKRRSEYLRGRRLLPTPDLTVSEIILLNGERFPYIRSYNLSHLSGQLKKFARRHPKARKILWLYDPHQVGIVDRVPHDLLVYDIMDEYTGFPWSPPGVAEEEKALLSRADLVIAGTYALFESKKTLVTQGAIDWILSAVDFDHFHRAAQPGNLPDEMVQFRSRFRHIAGYYGVCDMRLDTDLIRTVAERLPDWGFIFIGPVVGEKIQNLIDQRIHNIFFIGRRHYNDLPAYARSFDVCTIPFYIDRLTRHINPTKVLEYFAANKPVVSVPIPDVVRFYSKAAFIAETPDAFEAALIDAIRPEGGPDRIAHGLDMARHTTWQESVQKIIRLLHLS